MKAKSPNILGWASTQCAKPKEDGTCRFPILPARAGFIQILHVHDSHWITTSNVNAKDQGVYTDCIHVYDSAMPLKVNPRIKQVVCSFYKCPSDTLRFEIMNIQVQNNSYDCGLFAVACATSIVHGVDPVLCQWDRSKMREHLICSFENKELTPFPITKERRVPLGRRVRSSDVEELFCICRMPNFDKKPMIECVYCRKWFHKHCEGLNTEESYQNIKWVCSVCRQGIEEMKMAPP